MPRFLLIAALVLVLIPVSSTRLGAQVPGHPPSEPAPGEPPPPPPPPPGPAASQGQDTRAATGARPALDRKVKKKTEKKADEGEEEEEDDDDEEVDEDLGLDAAPFSAEQKEFLKKWSKAFKEKVIRDVPRPVPPRISLRWRAETYTKALYQNDQSQGSVTFGTPHPRGDNYAGNNGFASELVLYLDGRVSDKVEVGARLKSRFHRQWADFYENGDLAVDESGLPAGADATGESLGMNHAAYIQLRGLYLRITPPIPTVKTLHIGSSDLGMYNAWTVGKVRFIDRDNANGVFLDGQIKSVSYHLSRITLPKLYASAGWNSGIDDPLVQDPFWTRDATYALKLAQRANDWLSWTFITSYLLDEEADINDPDTLGSTNFYDKKDGVVATLPRYQNLNSTVEFNVSRSLVEASLLSGFSFSDPDLDYVFNSVDGNQGISPVPMKQAMGYAIKARADILDPFKIGLNIRLEYFNIGSDWVATFGARRETDVLLTDGFLDGQVPTLNIANEFIDFRDPFYESIIGWHGFTVSPEYKGSALDAELEFSFLEYNTDMQDRCTGNAITDEDGNPLASQVCPQDEQTKKFYGVYPDFLYPDGMTDTDFFTYANTTDRGRDPRSVYRQNQARRTYITMARVGYRFDVGRGLRWDTKVKFIYDTDQRDQDLSDDDYAGKLLFAKTSLATQLTDELSVSFGGGFDWWDEKHRSGSVIGSGASRKADYPDYRTWKAKVFLDLKYQIGGATLAWYMEYLNKEMTVSRDGLEVESLSRSYRHIVRGIGTVSASF